METATSRALSHGHGLDTIAGYRVVVTADDMGPHVSPLPLDFPELVAGFIGANQYGAARELAAKISRLGRWAVVDTRYSCGCWGDERALSEAPRQDAARLNALGLPAPSARVMVETIAALADELGDAASMKITALDSKAAARQVASILTRWAPRLRFPTRFEPSNFTGAWTVRLGRWAGSQL